MKMITSVLAPARDHDPSPAPDAPLLVGRCVLGLARESVYDGRNWLLGRAAQ